jgi:putative endonuclease
VKLVLTESFGDSLEAIEREKQIKGWTRKKKEALINIDWQKLVKYSQKTSEKDFTLPCL